MDKNLKEKLIEAYQSMSKKDLGLLEEWEQAYNKQIVKNRN